MDTSVVSRIQRRRQTVFYASHDFRKEPQETGLKLGKAEIKNVSVVSSSKHTSEAKDDSILNTSTTTVYRPTSNMINKISTRNNSMKKSTALSPKRTMCVLNEVVAGNSILNKPKIPLSVLKTVNGSVKNKESIGKRRLNKTATMVSKNTCHGANTGSQKQLRITNFFNREGCFSKADKGNGEHSSIEDTIFGWSRIGIYYIPYIIYKSEKYCSIRMLKTTQLAKLLTQSSIIGECETNLECFRPTEVQCQLLTEINKEHCDVAFGRPKFTKKDLLVRLSNAQKYYEFLDICDRVNAAGGEGLDFGFTLISKKSYIPYTIHNGEKFIPLFYLNCDEERLEYLKTKAYTLPARSVLFLKFCCKYVRISTDMFENDPLEVINFDAIRKLSPPKTDYRDCWPRQERESAYQIEVVHTVKGPRLKHVKKLLN